VAGKSCIHDSKGGRSGVSLDVVPTEQYDQVQKGGERIDAQDAP
jgi:hypothetical protein